jgi:capsular exopolysaccharide synthesis family protein
MVTKGNFRAIDPLTRDELQEAIREIHIMAGLANLGTEPGRGPANGYLSGHANGHAAAKNGNAWQALRPNGGVVAGAAAPVAQSPRGFKALRGVANDDSPLAVALRRQLGAPELTQLPAPEGDDEAAHGHVAVAPRRSTVIGVTSAHYGDGKTTISIALASSLAKDFGADVMLADADFNTHSLARAYGLEGKNGLSEVLVGSRSLQSVTHRFARSSMSVVTAGAVPSDPGRMARSERLVELVHDMKSLSQFVVLDLPAALHSMNTPILAQRCDGVIVVVRAGVTTRKDLDRILRLLRDVKVLGVVVNRQHSRIPHWVERALDLRA